MIIRGLPDKDKAESLLNMSKIILKRLNETEKEKYPSNTLTNYYDIIRKLMECLNALDGIKIKGEGSHFGIINYICEEYGIFESDRKQKKILKHLECCA